MKVAKWGNSLAVRLPADLVAKLGLVEGDEVELRRAEDGAVKIAKQQSCREFMEGLARFQGRMPVDFKFDRNEANRRADD